MSGDPPASPGPTSPSWPPTPATAPPGVDPPPGAFPAPGTLGPEPTAPDVSTPAPLPPGALPPGHRPASAADQRAPDLPPPGLLPPEPGALLTAAPGGRGPLEPWPDTVHWQPISTDLIWVELIRLAIVVAIGLAVTGVGWAFSGHWLFGLAVAVVLVLGAWRAVAIVRAVRAWGYAERENDLLVRHGLLVRRLSIVPYSRMQFVDVSAGPLERAFDLATVQLHTAAAASDARVPGLRPAEASRLRDRLTALGEDRAEGL
ncbi:Classical arabinogalactan protein [Micromonospora noduli]|uniref:Classical arabinogalactan protein n=1 Tax=Micromonospora noduli TaxID=709876 RepID=A0A328N6L6_9ACTN|nr:Classical arabinogalactan protein [Micromonospora noduli]RAO22050.1 Classical arabinogalactan protein [Micromonospora noduli]